MTRTTTNFRNLKSSKALRTVVLAGATVVGLLTLPAAAPAANHHDRWDDHHDSHTDVRIDVGIGQPAPRVEEQTTRIWVEPVYRTVTDRVWVQPVTEDRCDRVWTPDRFEIRTGRHGVREQVLVEPAHWTDVHHQVVVSDGHWEDVQRQELVAPGHWEDRVVTVREDSHPAGFFGWFASIGR